MTPAESWNFIVSEHNAKINASESIVQNDWENYFADVELFGYSRTLGDVDSHRKLHLGSTGREIPDIILRKNRNDLFLVELKQYSLSSHEDFEKQILNYMAHTDLRLSIGILICNTDFMTIIIQILIFLTNNLKNAHRQGSDLKNICTSEARKPFFIIGFLPRVHFCIVL